MLKYFHKRRNNKGQSTIEYATLIIIVLGAFLTIQNYFKRGLQGRWKSSVDDMGDQYDPRVANSSVRHSIAQNTVTTIIAWNSTAGTWTTRTDVTNTEVRKKGFISIGAY